MAADRIVFIRHAEEHGSPGVTEMGVANDHSLTVRGWQRAGALARRLVPVASGSDLTPDTIFASRIGEGSETRRPQQTVSPLVALRPDLFYDTSYLKTEVDALMSTVLSQHGTVLVAWEHSMIPDCVALLPNSPPVPKEWPQGRYDLFWSSSEPVTVGPSRSARSSCSQAMDERYIIMLIWFEMIQIVPPTIRITMRLENRMSCRSSLF